MSEHFLAYIRAHIEALREELGADAMSVYERDEDERVARLLAWSGEKPREIAPFDLPPIGTCAKTGKGILIEKKHDRPKFRSVVIVPLEAQGEQFGVLNCASEQAEYFKSQKLLTAVRSVAEMLARQWSSPGTEHLH
ncbi:MAG: GAF domain-containing protein [Bdellovibrionaceae bacterium]|nr:GAF domain-containing protein [Bdellovibrionales bacterium]MCB9255399.1 GAF domain-containing protein [Pseudobdellovibrionaceae bacterium]